MPDDDMPEGQMRLVNVHQTKTHLSRLIDEAHAGETIVLAKAGMRSQGPLSQPDVLLESMDTSELEASEASPLPTEPPER